MITRKLPYATGLAALIAIGSAGLAIAQEAGTDPHHPANAEAAPQVKFCGVDNDIARRAFKRAARNINA